MFCYITLFLQHFSNSVFSMNRKQPHMFYGVNVSAMVIWQYFCNDYRYRHMFFKSNDYRYRYMEKR